MNTTYDSHYTWLDENILEFAKEFNVENRINKGTISAHGDKCYSYRTEWENAGIHFALGVAIYFLSYLNPWNKNVRNTANGWVPVETWVIDFYNQNKENLSKFEN